MSTSLTSFQKFKKLRWIEPSDDLRKLSLGNKDLTPLKTFLMKQALDYHKNNIAKTYVLVDEKIEAYNKPRVWGYISLMASEINLKDFPKTDGCRPQDTTAAIKYDSFPAIKIARFAIDKSLQGQGYGKQIIRWCINYINENFTPHIGCRYLIVDAKNSSIDFYKKTGFDILKYDENNSSSPMYIDIQKHFMKEEELESYQAKQMIEEPV